MEIQLSSKRKLGFVNGTEVRSTTESPEAVQWDTCNSMVISWIHNNVCDSIKQSILFITSASEVWKQLEKRFQLTHGSRKYKISKEVYGMKQNGATVNEYFTSLSSLWEELDSMNLLPTVTTTSDDISRLLKALHTQKEEGKLFQFLNGLDDVYSPQRSQLLMITPLPSVEMACAAIQQEESQREVLKSTFSFENNMSAMFTKSSTDRPMQCTICGGRSHSNDKCWNVVGYPKWHYKYKPGPSAKPPAKPGMHTTSKWTNPRSSVPQKGPSAANVSVGFTEPESSQQTITFSPQQLQQLLHLLPAQQYGEDSLTESPFSGMITCNNVQTKSGSWIVDTGATDHMTANFKLLHNVKVAVENMTVNLPTGATTKVTHLGDVKLENGLKLLNVLYVPVFSHNLLSIHKLSRDNGCYAVFSPTECTIVDSQTHEVKGKGVVSKGLYHLSTSATVPTARGQ
ncbi:uncharacterized protein LOC141674715 [Apium graveolens]|uniref:uncharacterized protein LOC141674715 n=1 Tax=Apium graveolens TaxID=4045 RepID=UPI003D7BDF5A